MTAVSPAFTTAPDRSARRLRAVVVLAGLVAAQVVLIGPSLIGARILLPLDVLAMDAYYLPGTAEYSDVELRNPGISDPVLIYEHQRRFAAREIRAGRLPLWIPHQYAGAPSATWATYSPFHLPYYLFPGPATLAWVHLIMASVAGLGAYVYLRRALGISFWPAAVAAWCYPLTGFFVFWQGYPMLPALAWLPWLLVVVERVIARPRGVSGPLLAGLTGVVAVSGQVDFAAQVLAASGLYAVGRLTIEWRRRRERRALLGAGVALAAAWLLGILLAAPFLLPFAEYLGGSARLSARIAGYEARPPIGLAALPQTVLPAMYGAMRAGSWRIVDGNQIESSAAAYAGLAAALLLAPLAWCSARHRPANVLWLVLGLLGLAWSLDVPGLVTVLRLPGLRMLSHNRFVFVTAFALLAMAAVALERLREGPVERRPWFLMPVAVLVGLGAWCVYRADRLPEPLATQLEEMVRQGVSLFTLTGPAALERIRQGFRAAYLLGALWCSLAVLGWVLVRAGGRRPWLAPLLAGLWIVELVVFARGASMQSDPRLYYPRIPVLERLAEAPPGRVLGLRCLPPRLAESHGLSDLRGIDGIEPSRILEVLRLAEDPRSTSPAYATTQWYLPRWRRTEGGGLDLPPVLDMLGLRYLVFRGSPVPGLRPLLAGDDYWVVENAEALPRVFVPRRVETVADDKQILSRMAAADFDPREVAYLEEPVSLPAGDGTVEIVEQLPRRIAVAFDLPAPALVVLAENWDAGWRAEVEGRAGPSLRVNYTLNGAVAPGGRGRLVFRYSPASFRRGLALMLLASVVVLAWLARVRPGAR